MVAIIRKQKILNHFPKRTEADLYLWIIEHLAYLQAGYRQKISFDEAARHFSENFRQLKWTGILIAGYEKLKRIFRKKSG